MTGTAGPAGTEPRTPLDPDRNLALDLVRATEAAAVAAARHLGRGDTAAVDAAAVDAMRPVLSAIPMDGTVVVGEGEKDCAPLLFHGERVGNRLGPQVDIAVDPVDGTALAAKALPNALSVVAAAERGSMLDPGPIFYMEKLVVSGDLADAVEFEAPVEENLRSIARAKGTRVQNLTVCILDRPRHEKFVDQVRTTGARIKFLLDGDVAGAILAADPDSDVDLLVGIGGTPEGVIAACALKCLGAVMYGRLYPTDLQQRIAAEDRGFKLSSVLDIDDLVRSDQVFFAATGVTDGELLSGVRFRGDQVRTRSLSMRSHSGAIRYLDTRHDAGRSALIVRDAEPMEERTQ